MQSLILKLKAALLALIVGLAGPASAAVLYENNSPTGPLPTPYSFTTPSFVSGAGPGYVTFQIQGYVTLDGDTPPFTDIFDFRPDGATVFSGTFNLGGGGTDIVFIDVNGATYSAVNLGFLNGGLLDVTVPMVWTAGSHTLSFVYNSIIDQGIFDEAWGVNRVTAVGPVAAAVPEPSTWAMMLIGFAGLGLAAVRRRPAAA